MFTQIISTILLFFVLSSHVLGQSNDDLIAAMQDAVEISPFDAITAINTELLNTEHNHETRLGLEIILAQAFSANGDNHSSKILSKKTLKEAITLGLKYEEGRAIYALGIFDDNKGNYTEALNYFDNARQIFSALSDYKMQGLSLLAMGTLHRKSGDVYLSLGSYKKAEECFFEALQLSREINSARNEIQALIQLAKLNFKSDSGIKFAQLAYDKSEKIDNKIYLRDSSELIANHYVTESDFKQAYKYLNIYQTTNAKLIRNESKSSISTLTNSLSTSKANYEIAILKKNERLNTAYTDKQIALQAIWLLVLCFFSIILFTLYRRSLFNKQTSLLKKQVTDRTKDIQTIGEFGKKITSLIELKQVVASSYQQVKTLFNADVFSLGIYQQEEEIILFSYTFEKDVLLAEYQIPVSEVDRLAVNCVCQNKELNLATHNERLNHLSHLTKPMAGSRMESVVYLPLIIESKVIGCITVQKETAGGFTDYDMDILRSISSYISVAVVNSMTLLNVKTIAYTDYLTQLPNRRSFIERYHSLAALNSRSADDLCIAITDIDNFKRFNDQYGHDGGDYVLKEVSKLFQESIRSQDVVARWGGEEFVFILPNTKLSGAITLLNTIRKRLAAVVYTFDNRAFSITSTFGVVKSDNKLTLDEMIAKADHALYYGKSKGKNIVITLDE